jgi:hypothetical protein
MSDALYTSLAATASKLIAQFGREVTITRAPASQVIDPLTGAKTCYDDEDEVIPCVAETLTTKGLSKRIPNTMIDGTRVLATDKMMVLDSSVAPLPERDKIDGWTIQELHEVQPASVPLVYIVRLRK